MSAILVEAITIACYIAMAVCFSIAMLTAASTAIQFRTWLRLGGRDADTAIVRVALRASKVLTDRSLSQSHEEFLRDRAAFIRQLEQAIARLTASDAEVL